MKNFLFSIGIIKQGVDNWKENAIKIKNSKQEKNTDQEVEQILLDSRKEEDIIFYHYEKNNLIKLNYEQRNKIQEFNFFEYDMDIEDDKIYLDEKEIENIKKYHVLNVLKPKVENYLSYKDIEFNCTFMRNIYSYAEEVGFENTIGYLLPLIQDLNYRENRFDDILIAFLDTFEKFLIYLNQYDKDHSIILGKLLPIISGILTTRKEMNLLNKAVKELKFLIDHITMEECLNNIIPILIEMANDDENEIGQTISIQIFSEKAHFLGGEIIEIYVLPMFEAFSENNNENLRIYCIKYMIPLFETMKYEIIQTKFIKIYTNFCKDKSFQIRKISCNMLPTVCETILNNNNEYDNSKIKKEELISKNLLNIFFSFTQDEGIEIQNCALSIFGEFIFYLDNKSIISSPKLLDYYIKKIDSLLNLYKNRRIESTILFKVCFSFPSILLIYCKKINDETEKENNWNKLKPIYLQFIKSKESKIKKPMAASFGEISSILPQKIVEAELSPLISQMYNNSQVNIKKIIIGIIPEHLKYIKSPKIRTELLVIFKKGFNSIKSIKNWREKLKYIKGIKAMGNIFDNSTLYEDLLGMIINMSFDPYNIIRVKAIKILSLFLLKFLSEEKNNNNSEIIEKDSIDYKKKAIVILKSFATCIHYHYRQLFIYLCSKIITNEKIFKEYAFELFDDLSYDKIVNVRYTMTSFIHKIWNKNKNKNKYDWIKNDEKIREIVYRLRNDSQKEVKECANTIDIEVDLIEDKLKVLEEKDTNVKFTNEFQEFKNIFNYEPSLGINWTKKK